MRFAGSMRGIALFLTVWSAGLSATAALPAQNVASPPGMANTYGNVHTAIPWGGFGSVEQFYQQVHEDLLGSPLCIQGMAFRHAWNTAHAARSYTATLTLGGAAAGATETASSFASNWLATGSKTVVLKGKINFPAAKSRATPPAPFDAPISFTSPYPYDGFHPLIWQVHISASSASTPAHYFEAGPSDTHKPLALGKGCPMSGRTVPLASTGGTTATVLAERLSNGPASGSALLFLGDTSARWWGQELPFSLGFAGSPSCFLRVNVLALVPATTTWLFAAPYEWSPELAGIRFRTQWAIHDNGFIRTSNGLEHSFPYIRGTTSAWPQARVWSNSFGNTLPADGIVEGKGLVTQFRQ